MPWINLYGWEPGCEPDCVREARAQDIIARRQRYQLGITVRTNGIARAADRLCIDGRCDTEAVMEIGRECVCGPLVVRRTLVKLGYEVEADTMSGYPLRWSGLVRSAFRRFIEARLLACEGESVLCEDVCIEFIKWANKTQERDIAADITEIVTSRGITMAFRALGYHIVRRNAGMALLGYYIK